MSTKFDKTVAAIAGCPVKVALFKHIPHATIKTGAASNIGKSILEGIATGVGTAAVIGGGALAFDALRERLSGKGREQSDAEKATIGKLQAMGAVKKMTDLTLKPHQEKAFKEALRDPTISRADKAMMESVFETMKRFAPNLAADPNAAKSFLKEHAVFGTGPSYASLKTLVETEAAIAKSGGSV